MTVTIVDDGVAKVFSYEPSIVDVRIQECAGASYVSVQIERPHRFLTNKLRQRNHVLAMDIVPAESTLHRRAPEVHLRMFFEKPPHAVQRTTCEDLTSRVLLQGLLDQIWSIPIMFVFAGEVVSMEKLSVYTPCRGLVSVLLPNSNWNVEPDFR